MVDIDVATSALTAVVADLVHQEDLDGTVLAGVTRAARYETLVALAEDNLRLGCPVVAVAPFTAERRDSMAWARVADRLRAAGGVPTLVWVKVSRELLRERLQVRAAARDRTKLADLAAFLDRVPLGAPVGPHVAVDAAADVESQCSAVLAGLG
ncbi:MAG: hypothetical protein JWO98_342 [Frankiales bacterium]|nr:hypothetical protein [Frankiales bacterium]